MLIALEQYPKDDCLRIPRLLCVDVFRTKLFKVLLLVIVVVYTTGKIVQTYLFLSIFEVDYFLRYATMYCQSFFVISTALGNLIIPDMVVPVLKELKFWKRDLHKGTQKRIECESNIASKFMIALTIFSTFTGCCYAWPDDDDKNIFYIYNLIYEYVPFLKWPCLVLFKLLFIPGGIIMSMQVFTLGYGAIHGKFQTYLLIAFVEKLKTLDENYKGIREEIYHKEIKTRLLVIIKRHSHMLKIGHSKQFRSLTYFILVYAVTGTMLGISIVIFYFTFEGSFLAKYLRVGTIMLICTVSTTIILHIGQSVENISAKFLDVLCELNWYRWNQENKRLYLTLITNSTRIFRLNFSQKLAVNYRLGFSIMKTIYTALSIAVKRKM